MMREKSAQSGAGRVVLIALICLVVGGWLGRSLTNSAGEVEKRWQSVDELHRMFLAPSSYNFVESNKSYETQLISMIHDQLLHYDAVRDRLTPALAKSYEVSSDGLTWTFHLRDAKTPDGTTLNSDDVVFSFGLCLDSRFDCKKRGNLIIKGKPIQVTAVDSLTVRFELPAPYYSFDWAVSDVTIVPKQLYESVAETPEKYRQAVGVQQPELKYLSGFGPYAVESQDTQEIRLVRNDQFWGRGDEQAPRPYLKSIVLTLHNEDMTSMLDFVNDPRFVYRLVGVMEAERLREDTGFQLLDRGISGWCWFFWVNQNPHAPWGKQFPKRMELFQKVEFRRSLAHAIDRRAIVRNVFQGQAEPLFGPVSPIYSWVAPPEALEEVTPKPDPQAALAELAKLGVVPGEADGQGKRWLLYEEKTGKIPLELEIRTSIDVEDRRRKMAEEVKAQLESIGIRVRVVEERFGEMVMRLDKTFDYEAAVMALSGAPDAATLRFFFESSGPMHFVNPYQKSPATDWERQVDELFDTYATSTDASARKHAILEMQKVWSAAQPAFHLVNDRMQVAVRRDYEINGLALTSRASDPIFERTIIENVRIRQLVPR